MTRQRKERRPRLQNSPFLNLPTEIREQIYHEVLVRSIPIDLWPLNYKQGPPDCPALRLQEDILFVRREMATGLLTTCKQIFHEASSIFWSKNTFRFSGDIEWFGARRFLGQIGPRALSQIQSLELFAPLADAHCLDVTLVPSGDLDGLVEFYTRAREAKNEPKMHMAKARKEPWKGTISDWNSRFTLDHTNCVLTRNVEHVCYLLDMAKTSLDLRLVLPRGFGLVSVYGSSHFTWGPSGYQLWAPNEGCQLPEYLLMLLPLIARSLTLVIEAGACLRCLDTPNRFTDEGINVLCEPGSFLQPRYFDDEAEFLEPKLWMDSNAKYDYLVGVSALFHESQGISVTARGGRTTVTSGLRTTHRFLKGFGGCRFVERDVWSCRSCPAGKGATLKKGRWVWPNGLRRNRQCQQCFVTKVLVIKKKKRAARMGIVGGG